MRWRLLAAAFAAVTVGVVLYPQYEERRARVDLPSSGPEALLRDEVQISRLRAAVRGVDEIIETARLAETKLQPVPGPLAPFREEAPDSLPLVESRDHFPGKAIDRDIAARFESLRGIVLTERLKPLPHSVVRLRDLETGRLTATLSADDSGRFTFGGLRQSWAAAVTVPLLLEVLDFGGRVIATVVPRVEQFDEPELQVRIPETVLGERPLGDLESYLDEVAAAAGRYGIFGLLGRAPPASPSQ